MSNLVEISHFQPKSFGVCLRRIYREIDQTSFSSEVHFHAYKEFFVRTRGRFLAISRKKKNISLQEAGNHLGVPFLSLELIENGKAPIAGAEFLKLCRYYGTQQEALILTEKIESALKPKPLLKNLTDNVVIKLSKRV